MSKNKENVHEDHRQRMWKKYQAAADSMPDHELLEMLLFAAIPRKNTNPIAHALLNRFGTLDRVFCATPHSLTEIEGIGLKTALFLTIIGRMWRRIQIQDSTPKYVNLDSLELIAKYLCKLFWNETYECVYVLLIDSQSRLIGSHKICEGTLSGASIDINAIAKLALANDSARIVVAHNHPGGSLEPSDEDLSVTRFMQRVFSPLSIKLEEHFIISGNSFYPIIHNMESVYDYFLKNTQ